MILLTMLWPTLLQIVVQNNNSMIIHINNTRIETIERMGRI